MTVTMTEELWMMMNGGDGGGDSDGDGDGTNNGTALNRWLHTGPLK